MERADRIKHISAYYFSKKLSQIREMNAAGKNVINLGIGSPDLPPPTEVRQSLSQLALQEIDHGYQSYAGIPELRHAFANWYHSNYGIEINNTTEVLPLIGSKEGIMHISMAFLNPGDTVLVPNPGYPAYKTISEICGAKVQSYTLKEDRQYLPDFEEIEAFNLDATKIMWLNYPHMPTGAIINQNTCDRLVKLARQHNFLLCLDNPYAKILNSDRPSLFAADPDKEVSIELSSLSKHYNMAGWRIGAVLASEEHIKHILTFKSNMDSGMHKGLQLAATKALELGEDWFENLNKIYSKRRVLVYRLFDQLNCQYKRDSAGLFVWAKIPESKISGEAYSEEILTKCSVFITPGFIFGTEGDQYLRASLCQSEAIIQKAIDRCK